MKLITITATMLAAVLLTGCGAVGAGESARQTVSAKPAAEPTDTTRQTCHELSGIPQNDIDARFDPTLYVPVVEAAKTAKDPGVAAAGVRLRGVVAANEQLSEADRRGDPNLKLMEASLAVAQACGNLYGDGPW